MSRKITWGAKISAAKKGHAVSQETRNKISRAKIGKPSPNKGRKMSKEFCEAISERQRGRVLSENHKRKIGEASKRLGLKPPTMIGAENPRWIADRTKIKIDVNNERGGPLHKQWSQSVKRRDGWKCKISNGDCAGQVAAHHILSWRDFVDLRYEVNNGITLCHFHHPRKRNDEMRLSPYFQNLVISEAN